MALLARATRESVTEICGTRSRPAEGLLETVEADAGAVLWEVPENLASSDGVYAWVAGESSMVKHLRGLLVHDVGLSHSSVAFMGYWRLGTAQEG